MNKAKLRKAVDASTEPLRTKLDNIALALKEKINKINGSEETKKVKEEVELLKDNMNSIQQAQSLILEKLDKLNVTHVTNVLNDPRGKTKEATILDEKLFIDEEAIPIIKSDLDTKNIKKKKIKVKSKSSKKNVNDVVAKLKSMKKKKRR